MLTLARCREVLGPYAPKTDRELEELRAHHEKLAAAWLAEAPDRLAKDFGFVYFIRQSGPGGCTKIGFSGAPWERLCQLQTGSPSDLHLLGAFPAPRSAERDIHRELKAWATRRGEWYRPDEKIDNCFALLMKTFWGLS